MSTVHDTRHRVSACYTVLPIKIPEVYIPLVRKYLIPACQFLHTLTHVATYRTPSVQSGTLILHFTCSYAEYGYSVCFVSGKMKAFTSGRYICIYIYLHEQKISGTCLIVDIHPYIATSRLQKSVDFG